MPDEEGEAKALDGLMGVYLLGDNAKLACMEACEISTRMGPPMSRICADIRELLQVVELPSVVSPLANPFNSELPLSRSCVGTWSLLHRNAHMGELTTTAYQMPWAALLTFRSRSLVFLRNPLFQICSTLSMGPRFNLAGAVDRFV